MGRKPLGDRPMTDVERQQRQREKTKQQRDLARDSIEFLRYLNPPVASLSSRDWKRMTDLQRRIREIHPEINVHALDYVG